ncbi:MAG: c-type cytochrome [Geminicoccaceae bacterium]|nr:c-type cytochrome [Geminicoccaceae bacterium]
MTVLITWKRVVAVIVLAGLLGLGVAFSGVVPIAASSGHWAITYWFLHTVMRRSVAFHAPEEPPPPLGDPALIHRGAGHFATGCAPCHGAPGEERSPVVREMTPEPPYLPPKIPTWEPNELFWIVRHGVKYSGMPAWPALHRKDEVWAVTAFLLSLPELDEAGYRELALGPVAKPAPTEVGAGGLAALDDPLEVALRDCARCHGRDGLGRGVGAFPPLPTQTETYLHLTLDAFARGERQSGIMETAAARVDAETRRRLAEHYARPPASGTLPSQPADRPPADADLVLGKLLVEVGRPKAGIPPCLECHQSDDRDRYPAYPSLDGQTAEYLRTQLELFRDGARGGTPYAHIMTTVAGRMRDADIAAAAAWFARRHESRRAADG